MSKKRKHDQVENDDDSKISQPQPKKKPLTLDSSVPVKSKGDLKQEKSEGKAKKQKEPKEAGSEGEASAKQETEAKLQAPESTVPAKSKGQLKQEKSERRAKKQEKPKEQGLGEAEPTDHVESLKTTSIGEDLEQAPKESTPKKDKKRKATAENGTSATKEKKNKTAVVHHKASEEKSAAARFIVFVGNLPYHATVDQIKAHFSKVSPTSVRLSTEKGTKKGKGFAFVEFDHYDKMKTCLKLYHHSIFDPDAKQKEKEVGEDDDDNEQAEVKRKKGKGRRINVELTAGGGGKSKDRKAKIKSKNHKLGEEREKRRVKDMAERDKNAPKQKGPVETGANATEVHDRRGDVHPSRLSRVSH